MTDDYQKYVPWEAIDRLLVWKGMDTRACPSCMSEYHDEEERGGNSAGIEVFLGKGRYTNIDCKRADKLQQLKEAANVST